MVLLKRKTGQGKTTPARPLEADQIAYFADREAGRLNFELLSLEHLALDPSNSRTEGVDPKPLLAAMPKFLVIDPNHSQYDAEAVARFDEQMSKAVAAVIAAAPAARRETIRRLFENLIPLRNNIRLIGVKQPIEVRPQGRKQYRIVYGHRRYLASLLAGERNIPARIVTAEARDKHVQASENLLQESLTLAQRVRVLEQLLEEFGLDAQASATQVAALTGYARSQVALYLALLRGASADLRSAVEDGCIASLELAAKIARLPAEQQAAAIEQGRAGEGDSTSSAPKPATKNRKSARRGRRRTSISTPPIREPIVIRELMIHLGMKDTIEEIDWSDLDQVQAAWNDAINTLVAHVSEVDRP